MQSHRFHSAPAAAEAPGRPFELAARRHRRRTPAVQAACLLLAVLGLAELWQSTGGVQRQQDADGSLTATLTTLSAHWVAMDRAAPLRALPCDAPMELCPPLRPAPAGTAAPAAQLDRLLHRLAVQRSDLALQQALLGSLLVAVAAGLTLAWRSRGGLLATGLAAEASARGLLLRDPLTQLLNRRALDFTLPRMLRAADRAGRPIAVLAVALDGMRAVAAEHGAEAGDELLQVCAHRIHAHVREIDVVAHLPQDDGEPGRFVVVLEAPESAAAAQLVCDRVREALAEPLRLSRARGPGAPRVQVGPRIGLAVYPLDALTADKLLQRASDALQREAPPGAAAMAQALDAQRLRKACESMTTGTRPTSTMASEGSAASASLSSRAKL